MSVLLGACAHVEVVSLSDGSFDFRESLGAYLTRALTQQSQPISLLRSDRHIVFAELARVAPTGGERAGATISEDGSRVSLNFVAVDVQEFVRVMFEEVPKQSAVVDLNLTGHVTVRTVKPVSKSAPLDGVRSVPQMDGASQTWSGSAFKIGFSNDGSGRCRQGETLTATAPRRASPS